MPEGFAEYLLSFRPSQQKGHGLLAAPFVCALRKKPFLQVLLVALDHLFDHLAADRAGLAGGQIAVVALLEVDADLAGGFHLELVHSGLGLGDVELVAVLAGHNDFLLFLQLFLVSPV